ncbi:MAG: hypothetical protein Q9169_003098 [Polycauliona sp. 2 TL-2023]
MSNGLQTVDKAELLPQSSSSTPGSAKSKYRRKFDRNLLADPSISRETEPQSSSNTLKAVENEVATPTRPSSHPSLENQPQSEPDEQVRNSQAPSAVAVHKSPPSNSQSDLPTPVYNSHASRPNITCPPSNTAQPYGNISYPTYHISPTPPSVTSSPYGREAYHRAPVGIDPSPPDFLKSIYGSHTLTPSEPMTTELTTSVPAVSPKAAPRDDKRKHSIEQKPRASFKRFFHMKK